MPLMVTFFNVRKGRDGLFKRGMRGGFPTRGGFPKEMRRLEREYGIRFVGWFNVTEGSTWDNVVILDLPNYSVLDKLYADTSTRGHRALDRGVDLRQEAHDLPARADGPGLRVQAMTGPSSPRIVALRELAADAELERGDFLYEATEQLRRFLDANRERLREIGPIKLVDDEQDYLLYHPIDETWTTRLTYQDPADSEWYDQEQVLDSIGELIELYNPADIFAWLIGAARDAPAHLVPADELAREEELVEEGDDWQAELPPPQQETLAAQRLWQLADAYRTQLSTAQAQHLREFTSNAEEVLRRTGDLVLLEEPEDVLVLRADGRFETSLDLSEHPEEVVTSVEARRPGLTVTEARTIAAFYDPADVLHWVTDALAERYPAVDFSAVYE